MNNSSHANSGIRDWRSQLDQFVKDNQQELAALAWGLFQQRGREETLGIDLKPTPHFVFCPREALETLNEKVGHFIQEILGVIDAYEPEQEVVILGVGNGQLKLMQFQPDPPPPVCFEQVTTDLETLLEQLEKRLNEHFQS